MLHRNACLAEKFLTFIAIVALVVNYTGDFGGNEQFSAHEAGERSGVYRAIFHVLNTFENE